MSTWMGLSLVSIFLALSGLHFYWGFGGTYGLSAAVPQAEDGTPLIKPGVWSCFLVGLGLLSMGAFVLIKLGWFDLNVPVWILRYGLTGIGFLFIVRAIGDFKIVGFFANHKTLKSTPFARMDKKYYSPLCVLISLLAWGLELLG